MQRVLKSLCSKAKKTCYFEVFQVGGWDILGTDFQESGLQFVQEINWSYNSNATGTPEDLLL